MMAIAAECLISHLDS